MGDLPIVVNYLAGCMLLVLNWFVGALVIGFCVAGILFLLGKSLGWSTDMSNHPRNRNRWK